MNHCPNCGAAFPLGTRYCEQCGAAVHATKTRNLHITLSRREARKGCLRTLRYPGAPAPVKVRLPKKLRDGSVLYINDLPFLSGDGELSRGALRLTVQVKRRRLWPLFLLLFLFLSYFVGDALLTKVVRSIPANTPAPSAPLTASPLPAQTTPEPTATPAPTSDLSHLRPMQQQAALIIPHFELRYYLMELDDRLLENFCSLYLSVQHFQPSCTFPQPLNRNELPHLMLLLGYECPELLQFSSATDMSYLVGSDGNVISVDLSLSLTPEICQRQLAQCQEVAETLAQETAGLSEQEKELFAYEFLTTRCTYDFDAPYSASAFGALVDGRAKCDGISLAMKWLCEEMGIRCMVIAGNTAREAVGHAWNVICIDGTYYDLDVTNDVMSEESRERFFGAFNVSRHWLRDQYPENRSFSGFFIIPGSESMDMSYHALRNCYVPAGADAEALLFSRLENAAAGEKHFLQFESQAQYQDFLNRSNEIMSRWSDRAQTSFRFSFSRLDQFRVCCITLDYA